VSNLKEIAEHLGISYSTVSRAFDPNSRVGAETRKRILEYAEQVNYRPNLIARSLKKSETRTVGIIIPAIENIFYIDVLQRIELTLKSFGYRLIVSFVQQGVTTELECLELMDASQVDALIILPGNEANSAYVHHLSTHKRVIQLFHAPFDDIDSVVMDDVGGAGMGARHLLNRGHRRILFLGGADRVSGFAGAISDYGISEDEVRINTNWLSGEAVCGLILEHRPTAVFAIANMAERAWKAIKRLGFKIPDDISLIAYDDTKWVSMLDITAIGHDLANISSTLIEQLIFRLRSGGAPNVPPKRIVLDPFIVERSSVKNIDGL
jgi:LacI family transcriptional regulator